MDVIIKTDWIKLDSFLKWANLVSTGGQAKILIQEGKVRVNGEVETKRSRKIYPGDEVEVEGIKYTVKGGSE